mgnify:CR=1 FL=1
MEYYCRFFSLSESRTASTGVRNNIETLYQISLVKAFFLLYNTDTVEPRMQHPWRQREHPFFSDLIALIFWFSQCARYCGRILPCQYLLYVIPVLWQVPLMPAVLLPPPPLCPYRGGPLLTFWQHGRLCPGCHSQHKVFTSHVSFCVKIAVSLPDCSFILPGS